MPCVACRSETTVETRFDPSEGHSRVHFRKRGVEAGFFTSDRESFDVDRATVCLSCGHVALGFSAEKLARLQAQWPSLETIGSRDP